ncbi:MAG TPA: molybdopterin-dependent oxidoreductase [Stellaceae bacterium]|jgi:anaerobic selenocysteine-containing dehydrogenase|nr:molybdopterin-dependent oxidoreductase [Stellaceae bacterium]
MPLDTAFTVCPHDCPSACALEVERLDGDRIGRVHGARGQGYTDGVVCAKVARYAERQYHPERLSVPLRRVGEKGVGRAAFQSISWEDALDEVAERFARAAQCHGSETVWPYYYAGTMGLIQRDGLNRLRHAMRYSREDLTICNMLTDAGWLAGIGTKRGVDGREMARSDLIVVWGGNPVSTQVNVMTHIAKARKERGAKLVVVDPYRTGTAELADMHLAVLPGTDGALACGVMHVLFAEGLADRAYMARYTDDPAGLEAHLQGRGPAWAAAISGVPAAQITEFARLLGRTRRSFFRFGYGFSRQRNGAAQMHAALCLPAVTGAWQYEGGGAHYSNHGLVPLDRTLIEGLDRLDPSTRLLDQCRIGPILCGDKRDIGDGPPVSALLIQNTNPMVVAPESGLVHQGFHRDDLFVCVHEQFMTETAAMADIVLPATTFLEHDDIYTAGAHTYLQVGRAMVPPHAECRSNHDMLCALAHRLGADHRGFDMSAIEIIDEALHVSDLPGRDQFDEGTWHDFWPGFETGHFLNGFGHGDRKFHFHPNWKAMGSSHAGMPDFPDHVAVIDDGDPERPFRMVPAPSRSFLNTSFNNTPSGIAREGRPTAMIHPAALAELGLAEGDRVRIGNGKGSVVVHARAFDGLQKRVIVVEGLWPNGAFEEGIGINLLTSAEPGLPRGGGVFHDTSVWLRPA